MGLAKYGKCGIISIVSTLDVRVLTMLNFVINNWMYIFMKLRPLADRVVLKQNAAEERTSSGIFLTASAQEKPEIYEVVEVGPGGMVEGNEVKMIVEVGQKVLVGKYTGTKVKLEDVEYTIVRQSDILAIIE